MVQCWARVTVVDPDVSRCPHVTIVFTDLTNVWNPKSLTVNRSLYTLISLYVVKSNSGSA